MKAGDCMMISKSSRTLEEMKRSETENGFRKRIYFTGAILGDRYERYKMQKKMVNVRLDRLNSAVGSPGRHILISSTCHVYMLYSNVIK